MGFNFISKIDPGAFNGLSNVENLTLTNNPLTKLKGEMWQGLKNLKLLEIYNNYISNIEPNCFISLQNLESLNLQDNSLKKMKANMFNGLHSLRKLILSSNAIVTIFFPILNKLVHLDIVDNNVKSIKADSLKGLYSLKKLYLGMNAINKIKPRAFSNMSQLDLLNLEQNELTVFTQDVFNPDDFPDSNGHPPNLELDISGNPIKCDGDLCWLQLAAEDGWLGLYNSKCFLDTEDMYGPFRFLTPDPGVIPDKAVLKCSKVGK